MIKKSKVINTIISDVFGKSELDIHQKLLDWYDEAENTLFEEWTEDQKIEKYHEEIEEFLTSVSEFRNGSPYSDVRCIDELADVILSCSMLMCEYSKTSSIENSQRMIEIESAEIRRIVAEYLSLAYKTEEPWTSMIATDLSLAIGEKILELKSSFEVYEFIKNNPNIRMSTSNQLSILETLARRVISLSDFYIEKDKWKTIKTIRRLRYGWIHTMK